MRWLSIPFVFWLALGSASAQDLDQLRSRVADHWKKRAAGDRKAAAEYVGRQERGRFIETFEPPIKTFTTDSFRFSNNPREVVVVVKAKIEMPFGVVDKSISELWQWNGNWLLDLGAPLSSLFGDQPVTQALPAFELPDSEVSLERHVQGEKIPFSVRFKAKRSNAANIIARGLPGAIVTGIQWENEDGGRIEGTIDTTLIWSDISQPLTFMLATHSGEHISKTVKINAAIEGRVRLTQIPDVIDSAVASQIQLEVTNVSNAPVKLLGVGSHNPAYQSPELNAFELKPGESRRVKIDHFVQRAPDPASLILEFGDKLFPQPIVFPFVIKMPEEKPFDPASITPAILDQLKRMPGVTR